MEKCSRKFRRVVATDDVRTKLEQQGARPMHERPQSLAAFVRDSIETGRVIAEKAKIPKSDESRLPPPRSVRVE